MGLPATLPDAAAFVRFHTRQKLRLMAHSPAALNALGRLVAEAGMRPAPELAAEYLTRVRDVFAQPATRGGHVNALQHMVGYLRASLTDVERRHVASAIEGFANGAAPLSVPVSLIRGHAEAHRIQYLLQQSYLQLDEAGRDA